MSEPRVGTPVRGSDSGRPVMVLLDALGRRGALRLVWELRNGGQLTFRALQEACDTNPGLLNTRLKELRALDLVAHETGGYHLTEHGHALADLLEPVDAWARAWAKRH